jgi:diacylglycerol kinase (ATP)
MIKNHPRQVDITKLKVVCLINPKAANRKWRRRRRLRRYLQNNLPGEIIDTHQDKQFTIKTVAALSREKDVIIAAGGDGTIADVIQGIIESQVSPRPILGIIPLGSGNAFRKSLHIPRLIPLAVKVLHHGYFREIDLIQFNGQVAGFTSIGATAEVTFRKYANPTPGLWGHIKEALQMPNFSPWKIKLHLIDGVGPEGKKFSELTLEERIFDCVINKTQHFGYSWLVAPLARVDDGYLDITLFQLSGWQYLLSFPLNYFGLLQKFQKHYKAKEVYLQGKNLPLQYNGEPFAYCQNVHFQVLLRALKVICPPFGFI